MTDSRRVAEFPNWFVGSKAIENFEKHLKQFQGLPKLEFLQLGAYTGDASVWLMDNVLTHSSSILHDVDTWKGSDEEVHESIDFDEVYRFYKSRVRKYDNLQHYKRTTLNYLRYDTKRYEFIYIDADHTSVGVILDAELSWDLLKKGGIIAFDDYEWDQGKGPGMNPKAGINAFYYRHQKDLEIIEKNWQIWFLKK